MTEYFEITDLNNKFAPYIEKAKEYGATSIKTSQEVIGCFIEITSETALTDTRLRDLLTSWRHECRYPIEFVKSKIKGRRDFLPLY